MYRWTGDARRDVVRSTFSSEQTHPLRPQIERQDPLILCVRKQFGRSARSRMGSHSLFRSLNVRSRARSSLPILPVCGNRRIRKQRRDHLQLLQTQTHDSFNRIRDLTQDCLGGGIF